MRNLPSCLAGSALAAPAPRVAVSRRVRFCDGGVEFGSVFEVELDGIAARHSLAYISELLVVPVRTLTVAGRLEAAHRRPDIPGDFICQSVEHNLGLEVPAGAQVLFERVRVVQASGCAELPAAFGG